MNFTVCVNGELLKKDAAFIAQLTPGILKARGCFETLKADRGKVKFLKEHYERLAQGLKILRIPCPVSFIELQKSVTEVLESNPLACSRVRIVVFQKKVGVDWVIAQVPYKPLARSKYRNGIKVSLVKDFALPAGHHPQVKSLNYGKFLQAYEKVHRKGADEAVLVSPDGFLIEGSRSNLFIIKNGSLFTPPLSSGCLKGITRGRLIDLASSNQEICQEKMLVVKDLLDCDYAFLTNSLIGVLPIASVDGKKIGAKSANMKVNPCLPFIL